MITLSYELLGVMMIAPMIVIFIMYEILLNKKRKEIERARKANREDFLGLLGDKDKQIKEMQTKKPKTQYRKIEALRNRFKAIKKGEVYSGKEVIEDGIKMYSIKVNGATYILKRSNFKIIK